MFLFVFISTLKRLILTLIQALKQQLIKHIMGNIKQINIKNGTFNFFNDMINIKDFDPNLLKIEKNSYKDISIFNIGYIKIKNWWLW